MLKIYGTFGLYKGGFVLAKEKNHAIEIYRYLFAIFVCTLHFKEYYGNPYPWGGAYLSVEFFLILAGFFEMRHIYSHCRENGAPEDGIKDYVVGRIKRLFPQYIVALLLYYIYRIFVTNSITVKQALVDFLPEWGMIQILGFGKYLNSAMWYVSAMMFASIVIYFFAVKNRRRFIWFFAPAGVLLIYSWLYQTNHGFGGVGLKNRTLIICDGFWRALGGMLLGCIIYAIYDHLKKTGIQNRITVPVRVIMTICEAGILALITVLFYGPGNTVKDFTLVALMGVLVISTMLEVSYLSRALNHIPVTGKYTYALYCHHWLFQNLIKEQFPGYPFYPALIVFLIVSFGVSVLSTILINKAGSLFRYIRERTAQKKEA